MLFGTGMLSTACGNNEPVVEPESIAEPVVEANVVEEYLEPVSEEPPEPDIEFVEPTPYFPEDTPELISVSMTDIRVAYDGRSIDRQIFSITNGEKREIRITTEPPGADFGHTVILESSNENVFTIKETEIGSAYLFAELTLINPGEEILTVTIGDFTKDFKIKVEK